MDIFYKHEISRNMNPDFFRVHTHSHYEIYMIFRGSGSFVVEGHAYPIPSGSIVLLRPGEMHRAEIDAGCVYERRYFHFWKETALQLDPSGRLLQPFDARMLGMDNYYAPDSVDTEYIRWTLQKGEELLSQQPHAYGPLQHHLYIVLEEIYKGFAAQKFGVPLQQVEDPRIYEIIQHINANICNHLSVSEIEKQFFISRPVLSKRFKQATGTTVWNYIVAKRVVLANQMIQNGEPATQAAYACGFGDYSSFYRAYRRVIGNVPSKTK